MSGLPSIFYRYSIVKQIPIFQNLNIFDLQRITQHSKVIEYKKGELVCKQGDPPDGFYCLISGRIQAYAMNRKGQKEDVEFIRRGMHFGIVSLLTGDQHSLTFEAINDSSVLKIDKNAFQSILKSVPQLGVEFSHSLSKRFRSKSSESKSIFESSIISIYSPVKGTGSSTYAVNLALSLEQETHRKVILVNIGPHFHKHPHIPSEVNEATPQWKQQPYNLSEIVEDHDKIIQSVSRNEINIDMIHVSIDPTHITVMSQISQFVSALVTDYHYVVVDLPNEMDDVVLKTLTQSDIIQLVTLDRDEDLKMTRQVINQLEENLREKFNLNKLQVIISGRQAACYLSYEEVNHQIDFDVFTKLPMIQRQELNTAVVSTAMSVIAPNQESEYARAVKTIARQISGVQVGLVLGGGAALGVAHIGVIRVLEQEGIPIDIVVGSSMGALVAAFWATGMDAAGLEKIAREFEVKNNILKLFDPVVPISGLIGGRLIKRWLRTRGLGNKTFYSTRIPLKVVAYDLVKREEIIIDSGTLVEAVRRSIAIPGVIEPVQEKERVIIDGGVLNPLPTNVLIGLGIKKIIAINVLQSPEHVTKGYFAEQERLKNEAKVLFSSNPWHYISFRIGRAVNRMFTPNISDIIVRSLQASEFVIAEQSAMHADILIHPNLDGVNWFELYKVDDLIQRGEEAARKALPEIKKLLAE